MRNRKLRTKLRDFFAEALLDFYELGKARLVLERDDDFRTTEDLSWYLTPYREFPKIEKQALKLARGRVLDAGCGAGRHTLYLQRRGFHVTGIDASAQLVELARGRGVHDARAANLCGKLPFQRGEFETVILLGNNLGLCGTPPRFRHMLVELHRITTSDARILATTRMPAVSRARQRAYFARNPTLRRASGQLRLRWRYGQAIGEWFDFLLFAPGDLREHAAASGWQLTQLFAEDDFGEGYAAVLEKIRAN